MQRFTIGEGFGDMPEAEPNYATTAYTGEQIAQIDAALASGDSLGAAQDVLRGGLPAERCDER